MNKDIDSMPEYPDDGWRDEYEAWLEAQDDEFNERMDEAQL